MNKPLPHTPPTEASPPQTAAFWVQALHDLAQPVQALALFTERLRSLDLGAQAEPVVEHVGAGVQELQRVLQSLVLVAQRDADQVTTQARPPSEGQPPDLR